MSTPLPVDPRGLPPGAGQFLVPPQFTFNSLANTGAQAFQIRFDNALRASRENAWRMRLDPMIDGCLEARTTPTALLTTSVKPLDDDDPQQLAAAKRQQRLLARMPRRTEFRRWLVKEGLFVGRAGAQVTYDWTLDRETGRMMCYPSGYRLLNGDKLQFKWDGRAGVSVNSMSPLASHPNCEMLDGFPVYFPTREERMGLVVHRSFSEDADFYRPWFAGSIHGTGLRGKLYWMWALKSQLWQMSIEFLQWFARGLTVYYYEHGNDAHRQVIEDAVKSQNGATAMMYPVWNRVGAGGANEAYYPKPFDHIQVPTSSPQFLQNLITQYLDDLIRFVILHQSLTTSAEATGMGSGVANAHQNTFDNLVKLDATVLDDTETEEILAVMYATNEPGIPCGRVFSQVDSPNVDQLMTAAKTIVELGGTVAAQPLKEAAGLPEEKQGDTVLGGMQAQQPAAVGAVPDGMPMESAQDATQPPVS
jgi:hypothetical protein